MSPEGLSPTSAIDRAIAPYPSSPLLGGLCFSVHLPLVDRLRLSHTQYMGTMLHTGRRRQQDSPVTLGSCLADDERSARAYGPIVHAVTLPAGLVVLDVEVTRARIDDNDWPGDTAAERAEYAAQGADLIRYTDMAPNGRTHTCYRIVSQRAVDAIQ